MTIIATVTCIAAPLQVEGTIGGKPFYFRARHGEWTLSPTPAEEPTHSDSCDDLTMNFGDALKIIADSMTDY